MKPNPRAIRIGKRLEQLRKSRVISQRALAQKLGLAHTTVARYELGLTTPRTENLATIADFFGTEPSYFLEDLDTTQILVQHMSVLDNPLPLSVDHKVTADAQIQVDCWERLKASGFSNPIQVTRDIVSARTHDLTQSDATSVADQFAELFENRDENRDDLTTFLESIGYRILLTRESDQRYSGSLVYGAGHIYLLVSSLWPDSIRRDYLANLVAIDLFRTNSDAVDQRESFVNRILTQASKINSVAESRPIYGIDLPLPDVQSNFHLFVLDALRNRQVSRERAASLLQLPEESLIPTVASS